MIIKKKYFLATLSIFIPLCITLIAYLFSYFPPLLYLIIILLIYLLNKPDTIFSLKNIVFFYYFLWFTLPVMFATRYSNYTFSTREEVLAYSYLTITFIIIFFTLSIFEKNNQYISDLTYKDISLKKLKCLISISFIFSVIFFILYIQASGGFTYWLNNLDRAFLTREGSGIYYLPFSLFMAILSFALGLYIKVKEKSKIYFFLWLLFLLLLSPFIGSKSRVLLLFFLLLIPSLINLKLNIKRGFVIIVIFLIFFVLGNYFRNTSWMTINDLLPYMLNYFDTYDALVMGLRDIDSNLFETTFLPFNKFLSPFGFSGEYYDMSSWLTSIYYPEADKIRATVQWPIEMDLYLNYYYFLGLPLIIFIFYILSKFENNAKEFKIGYLFVSSYLLFYTLSHLRGGILLWTDFYLIPFFIISYFLFNTLQKRI